MFTAIFIGTTLVASAPALKSPGIVGKWVVERQDTGGGVLPFPKGDPLYFVFTADGKWAEYREGFPVVPSAKYAVDLKARPHSIDLGRDPMEKVPFSFEGVFKVDGDVLTLCYTYGRDGRPKDVAVGTDDPYSLFVMKRVK